MYKLAVILHLLGAAVWIGGHIVLCAVVLPRALREKNPTPILEFEEGYERLGVPALIVQLLTGIYLAYHWLPEVSTWFSLESHLSTGIILKFVLFVTTVLLAVHARLRVHPRLSSENLHVLAIHIVSVTVLSLLFLVVGVTIRTGGWW